MAISYFDGARGNPGSLVSFTGSDGNVRRAVIPAMMISDSSGNEVSIGSSALGAGTDRSGSITTGGTAQALAASNTSRKGLVGQNISAGDLWINEIGGTAAVDTSGSYKVTSGSPFSVSTNRAISIIGATTGQKFTATEY